MPKKKKKKSNKKRKNKKKNKSKKRKKILKSKRKKKIRLKKLEDTLKVLKNLFIKLKQIGLKKLQSISLSTKRSIDNH